MLIFIWPTWPASLWQQDLSFLHQCQTHLTNITHTEFEKMLNVYKLVLNKSFSMPPAMLLTGMSRNDHITTQDILVRSLLTYSRVGADPSYAYYIISSCSSHMPSYSTLYVAIVTLQCFSGIYIQQYVWWKRVPCSKLMKNNNAQKFLGMISYFPHTQLCTNSSVKVVSLSLILLCF